MWRANKSVNVYQRRGPSLTGLPDLFYETPVCLSHFYYYFSTHAHGDESAERCRTCIMKFMNAFTFAPSPYSIIPHTYSRIIRVYTFVRVREREQGEWTGTRMPRITSQHTGLNAIEFDIYVSFKIARGRGVHHFSRSDDSIQGYETLRGRSIRK